MCVPALPCLAPPGTLLPAGFGGGGVQHSLTHSLLSTTTHPSLFTLWSYVCMYVQQGSRAAGHAMQSTGGRRFQSGMCPPPLPSGGWHLNVGCVASSSVVLSTYLLLLGRGLGWGREGAICSWLWLSGYSSSSSSSAPPSFDEIDSLTLLSPSPLFF